MKTYAFVFARGGSKGVPKKNIRKLAGKPLLAYSIDLAQEVDSIDKVFVSTDDLAIAAVALEYGTEVIYRPVELAADDTPEWLAWRHAVQWLEKQGDSFDVFVSLPTTSPLRNAVDVENCLERLTREFDFMITLTEAHRSPWFNMVKQSDDGSVGLLLKGEKPCNRRQEVPRAYDMTTVAYVTRPDFILNHHNIWEGKVGGVLIPAERALDIDTELDLEIAEFFLRRNSEIKKSEA